MKYTAYADGGCRPKNNRCKDSYGYYGFLIVGEDDNVIHQKKGKLGNYSTNNIAEFNSLLYLIKYINQHLSKSNVEILMDSLLTVNIVNGNWQAKDKNLSELNDQIQREKKGNITLRWIKRDFNKADALTR